MAVYLRDQRRGLSARHYRVNDSGSSRCRGIYPDSVGTRLVDGNRYVFDYVVVFLLNTRRRQMERIHRPDSVESHRGILVQRCRPSLCLYRVIFGITAKENRAASVELTCRCWRPNLAYPAVLFARCVSHMITPRLACLIRDGRRASDVINLIRASSKRPLHGRIDWRSTKQS